MATRRFSLRRLALFALVLSLAVPAAAQTPIGPTSEGEAPPQVVTAKKTFVDFTNVHVVGELERPSGEVVWSKPPIKFRNLIELRANFRPELARSASKLP